MPRPPAAIRQSWALAVIALAAAASTFLLQHQAFERKREAEAIDQKRASQARQLSHITNPTIQNRKVIVRYLSSVPAGIEGKLIHTSWEWQPASTPKAKAHSQICITTYSFGEAVFNQQSAKTILKAPIDPAEQPGWPVLSPDGGHTAFWVGMPGHSAAPLRWCVIDNRTGKVTALPGGSYSGQAWVAWSPGSRRIVYPRGGWGGGDNWVDALTVATYDLRAEKLGRPVLTNDTARDNVAWSPQGDLFISIIPTKLDALRPTGSAEGPPTDRAAFARISKQEEKIRPQLRPDLYRFQQGRGDPKLTVRNLWHPVISPDGRWVAGRGQANPAPPLLARWMDEARSAAVVAARIGGGSRRVLVKGLSSFPQLLWASDSRHLIMFQPASLERKPAEAIRIINAATGRGRFVPLRAQSWMKARNDFSGSLLGITRNLNWVLLRILEIHPPPPGVWNPSTTTHLAAINLKEGGVIKIAEFDNIYGLDWHE